MNNMYISFESAILPISCVVCQRTNHPESYLRWLQRLLSIDMMQIIMHCVHTCWLAVYQRSTCVSICMKNIRILGNACIVPWWLRTLPPAHLTWDTGWRRCIGYLIFVGLFPQKSHVIIGSFAERESKRSDDHALFVAHSTWDTGLPRGTGCTGCLISLSLRNRAKRACKKWLFWWMRPTKIWWPCALACTHSAWDTWWKRCIRYLKRCIRCLYMCRLFPQKSPVISGSFTKREVRLRKERCVSRHPVRLRASEGMRCILATLYCLLLSLLATLCCLLLLYVSRFLRDTNHQVTRCGRSHHTPYTKQSHALHQPITRPTPSNHTLETKQSQTLHEAMTHPRPTTHMPYTHQA